MCWVPERAVSCVSDWAAWHSGRWCSVGTGLVHKRLLGGSTRLSSGLSAPPLPCALILAPLLWVCLNSLPHSNMYVLERVQHRVPEEALRVSAGAQPRGSSHKAPAPHSSPGPAPSASWLPWPGAGAMSQPSLVGPVLPDWPV